jgi:hypothetical protein
VSIARRSLEVAEAARSARASRRQVLLDPEDIAGQQLLRGDEHA